MNRRIIGLLATVCLVSACKEEPVGAMKPIPRPPGMAAAPAKAEAEKKPAPAPTPDPSKVVLRWKLDAPTAFRLTTAGWSSGESTSVFVLRKTEAGDYAFRIVPEGSGGEEEQGSMSERGFVLDGLSGPLRTTAALVLELPMDAVGPDATWALGTDLVDLSALRNFVEKKTERQNQVKLTALTPAENGEQVATLEYDIFESISGGLRPTRQPSQDGKAAGMRKSKVTGTVTEADIQDASKKKPSAPELEDASAEVRVKARGEFLVKAGRWRSWEGTVTTRSEGNLPGASNGEGTLRLTPLESVPPELLQPQAKK